MKLALEFQWTLSMDSGGFAYIMNISASPGNLGVVWQIGAGREPFKSFPVAGREERVLGFIYTWHFEAFVINSYRKYPHRRASATNTSSWTTSHRPATTKDRRDCPALMDIKRVKDETSEEEKLGEKYTIFFPFLHLLRPFYATQIIPPSLLPPPRNNMPVCAGRSTFKVRTPAESGTWIQ